MLLQPVGDQCGVDFGDSDSVMDICAGTELTDFGGCLCAGRASAGAEGIYFFAGEVVEFQPRGYGHRAGEEPDGEAENYALVVREIGYRLGDECGVFGVLELFAGFENGHDVGRGVFFLGDDFVYRGVDFVSDELCERFCVSGFREDCYK